jgi:hypothetical protein
VVRTIAGAAVGAGVVVGSRAGAGVEVGSGSDAGNGDGDGVTPSTVMTVGAVGMAAGGRAVARGGIVAVGSSTTITLGVGVAVASGETVGNDCGVVVACAAPCAVPLVTPRVLTATAATITMNTTLDTTMADDDLRHEASAANSRRPVRCDRLDTRRIGASPIAASRHCLTHGAAAWGGVIAGDHRDYHCHMDIVASANVGTNYTSRQLTTPRPSRLKRFRGAIAF